MAEDKDWFEKWFDSPYYHLLYRHRDQREADQFLVHLTSGLKLSPGARILDMACGKGRHCFALGRQGFDVTGIDIAPTSIAEARKHEDERLSFFVHDMRKPFRVNYFDCVLNLFTSFGYFSPSSENEKVVKHAAAALKPGGTFVLDFMNMSYVLTHLCPADTRTVDGIEFGIKRYLRDDFLYKDITVNDNGRVSRFTERVQALQLPHLKKYFEQSGLNVIHLWGDYELNPLEEHASPRLIIAGQK